MKRFVVCAVLAWLSCCEASAQVSWQSWYVRPVVDTHWADVLVEAQLERDARTYAERELARAAAAAAALERRRAWILSHPDPVWYGRTVRTHTHEKTVTIEK